MRRASNVLLCVGLLALLAIPATALSQGGVQSGWAGRPPTLNGSLAPGEWADATKVRLYPVENFDAAPLGGKAGGLALGEEVSPQQVSGWARLMNDAQFLYLAATLDIGGPGGDPDYWIEGFYFVFEDEPTIGDGRWAADLCSQNPDEGGFVSASGYYPMGDYDYDYFLPASEDQFCAPPQFDPPGYRRALGWGTTIWEVRFDLTTSALDVAPGHCFNLGLLLDSEELYFPDWYVYGAAMWPQGLLEYDQEPDFPDTFGRVCLAQEEEFVPEPGTIALLGTGLAGLSGYAALRWRSRRKE